MRQPRETGTTYLNFTSIVKYNEVLSKRQFGVMNFLSYFIDKVLLIYRKCIKH